MASQMTLSISLALADNCQGAHFLGRGMALVETSRKTYNGGVKSSSSSLLKLFQTRGVAIRSRRRFQIVAAFPDEESEEASPGAVTYKRSAIQSHYECQTTLESLGLRYVSSGLSRSVATSMGLMYKGSEAATPVSVSFDVTKDKDTGDLMLEGIVRTAVSVTCNRCLSPLAERIFSNFSVLLTRKPVEEPTQQSIGVVLGEEQEDSDEPVLDIDLDDKLHFPAEVKEMDLSSYIRDTVHLEIPFFSLCSSSCKGLCTRCGFNLNNSECTCHPQLDAVSN